MALLTTSGIPSDGTGAAGDYAIDPVAHFIYGPKTTTWNGTASNLAGPSGPGLVYGQGAPTTNQGAIGQGYLDLLTGNFYGPKAANGAWGNAVSKIQGAPGTSALSGTGSPITNNVVGVEGQSYLDTAATILYVYKNGGWGAGTALIGATGAPGPVFLNNQAMTPAQFTYASAVALSTTPYVMVYPGTTVQTMFVPVTTSALMGLYAYTNVAATLQLYNQTDGVSVYTASLTAGANFTAGPFSMTAYVLAPNKVYVWRLTGSATATVSVLPYYLSPSSSPGLCAGQGPICGYSTSTTFSSTAANLPLFGTAQGANTGVYVPLRTAGVYGAVATYTPTGSTTSSSSVTVRLFYASLTNNSGAAMGFTFAPVPATGTPTIIFGPQTSDQVSLSTGNYFYWQVTGSGTGTLQVQLLPLV